jgi:hypothetical protein
LVAVVEAVTAADQVDWAERIARSITRRGQQARALISIAEFVDATGRTCS